MGFWLHRKSVSGIMILLVGSFAHAAGVPKTCPLKSQELKIARECFSGDMRLADDFGTFLGTDETSKEDLNFCYHAFVILHPQKGSEIQLTVLKDNPKGQLHIYNYSTQAQALLPPRSASRTPASKAPTAISFKNLKAQCFAHRNETDKCSKGLFGIGNTDIPLTIELSHEKLGFKVKGPTKDKGLIETAANSGRVLEPKNEADAAKTSEWLLQVVKQRLLRMAQNDLARIKQKTMSSTNLANATTQFRYCRMAVDGFIHQRKITDPFSAQERQVLDSLEDHLKNTSPMVPR